MVMIIVRTLKWGIILAIAWLSGYFLTKWITGEKQMPRKTYSPEQIIKQIREAEILINQGNIIGAVCNKIGVSDVTYYRWRKEYGGMRVDEARRLKDLEQENARLKKVIADFALDNAILKEAARGNF